MANAARLLVVAVLAAGSAHAGDAPGSNVCPVTAPEFRRLPGGWGVNHGDGAGLATLARSPVVLKPGGPGCVAEDGSLLMKWPWWKGVAGTLSVTGRSLDGRPGDVRVAYTPYGATGFQPSALVFPGPGCWEVTGRVGDASVTFVTQVERVGRGPSNTCDQLFPREALRRLRESAPAGRARP